MTDHGMIINDRAGIPIVDGKNIMIKLHDEGVVTVPSRGGIYTPGTIFVNFKPCIPLPIITTIDIDDKTQTFFEDFATFSSLQMKNGSNQWYRFQMGNFSTTTTKFKWRVWIRDDF
jgi:hypothetical protein